MDAPVQSPAATPLLRPITSAEEIPGIAGRLKPADYARLQQVDFDHRAIVALFRGAQPSLDYPVVIERIDEAGDRLIVRAQLWGPGSGRPSGAEIAYPYDLVIFDRTYLRLAEPGLVVQWYGFAPAPPANTPGEGAGEVDVPFETLALVDYGGSPVLEARHTGPQLLLLTSPVDLADLAGQAAGPRTGHRSRHAHPVAALISWTTNQKTTRILAAHLVPAGAAVSARHFSQY